MIKYFKELENQNDNYINLIEWDHTPNDYPINKEISPAYWRKISFLMNRIKEYDLLYDNNSKTVYYSLDEQDEDTQISLEFEYSLYMNYYFNFHPNGKMMYGITHAGINKIDELKNRFKSNYKGNSFKDDFF
ncbi:MAG: hypothetical protein K5666_04440, partial [Bacilli bacterium]|nr:hypothetical protein [Bacilli bacterium]